MAVSESFDLLKLKLLAAEGALIPTGLDFASAEPVKAFPILQLAAGVLVILGGVFMIVRAARDNSRDSHVAPASHDPLGLTVLANSFAGTLATLAELARQQLAMQGSIHTEQIKTNSRLAELKDVHEREMDELRDDVKQGFDPPGPRPRRRKPG